MLALDSFIFHAFPVDLKQSIPNLEVHMKLLLFTVLTILALNSTSMAGYIRTSHLAPAAPVVDVYLNDQKVFSDVAFKSVTEYLPIPNGQYDVTVYRVGEKTNPIVDARGVMLEDATYTILAAGFGAGKATSTVVFEDWIEPIATRARLRVINASPDTPNLELALPGGLHILPQVIFKTASKYYTLPANTYDLAVRVDKRNDLILRDVKLEKGKVYTAFVVGRRADGTLNYLLTEDRTP
jgi:hypothetical protein